MRRKLVGALVGAGLAVSLVAFAPVGAVAETGLSQAWLDALSAAEDEHYDPHAFATSDDGASLQSDDEDEAAVERPEKFDLRNVTQEEIDAGITTIEYPGNYVTPVKFQNPWGVCWGVLGHRLLRDKHSYRARHALRGDAHRRARPCERPQPLRAAACLLCWRLSR